MTMSIIKPNRLTDAMLSSSTAAEDDHAVWDAATAYAAGDRVIRAETHRVYECLIAGTTPDAPEADTTHWLDIAPTNRWAMFDDVVGTITTVTGGLTAVMRPGLVSGLALMELSGSAAIVTMKDKPGGTTVYSRSVTLDGTQINSFYEWFYTDYVQLTDVVLTDLPAHFASSELTVSITAPEVGEAACGVCKAGPVIKIGDTQAGASAGIIDYSKKSVDAFGNYLIAKRAFSKRNDLKLVTKAHEFNRIFRALADMRSEPCVYIATEAPGFEPLLVYGFYRDFSIDVAYAGHHLCNLSIEGLI